MIINNYKSMIVIIFFMMFSRLILASSIISPNINCGPNALEAICKEYKVNTTIKNIRELSWYDPSFGTTMLGLVHAANILRLPAVPLRVDYNKLMEINKPSIVSIYGNHFSIAWKLTKNKVILQDYPGPRREITRKEFESIWNGDVIVFSKYIRWLKNKEIVTLFKAGPRIFFPLKEKDVGEIIEGKEVICNFTYNNIGSKPLETNISSDCTCTKAIISEKEIGPGKQGKIKVQFNTKGHIGPQHIKVNIFSNDPDNRLIVLSLRVFVKSKTNVLQNRI